MKKWSIVTAMFLAAAVALTFAPAATADEKKSEHGKMMSVKAEIVSINKASVEVKTHEGKTLTLAINDKTMLGSKKSPLKLDRFVKGDHVKINYSGEGKTMVALDIWKLGHGESLAGK